LSSCNWSAFRVATGALSSCNSSDKNYKKYMSRVATEMFKELQMRCLLCCNWSDCWVPIEVLVELQLYYPFSCNRTVVRVAIDVNSELQVLSASAWYCTTLQLQPDSGSSCNRCTLRVANTECFHLILYRTFSCNPTVVQVAIIFV
jgi:hypothetical protein